MKEVKNNLTIVLSCAILLLAFAASVVHPYVGYFVQSCGDTDGGKNYYTFGVIHLGSFSVEDSCVENKLQELFCGNNQVGYDIVTCSAGCNDGACNTPKEGVDDFTQTGTEEESYAFETGGDKLEIGEYLGDVVDVFTERDLDALSSHSVSTPEGSTDYNQYLRFKTDDFENGKIILDENEDGNVDHYLYFAGDTPIFEYQLAFENGFTSKIEHNKAKDFHDETLFLLGRKYVIIDTRHSGSTLELKLLGGEFSDALEEGQTKIYTVKGEDYKIAAYSIDDSAREVFFTVNAESFGNLEEGESALLDNGILLGVTKVIINEVGEGSDLVQFYIGADTLVLEDTYTDNIFTQGVRVQGNSLSEGKVKFKGSLDGDTFTLTDITYRLDADAIEGDDVFIPPGHTLREYIEAAEGLLGHWDIAYGGIEEGDAGYSLITLDPSGDDAYDLRFENNKGQAYNIDFLIHDGGLRYGDDDDTLYFIEGTSASDFIIENSDWFILTDDNDKTGVTHILRYSSIDTANKKLHFDDLSTGSKTMTYSGTEGTDAEGTLTVSGFDYTVYVGGGFDYNLAIDLNHDNALDGGEATIVTKGGAIIDLGSSQTPGSDFSVTLTTEGSQFDEHNDDEVITLTIQQDGSDIGVAIPTQSPLTIETEDDTITALSPYGVKLTQDKKNGPDELKIEYPRGQAFGDARVVIYSDPVGIYFDAREEAAPDPVTTSFTPPPQPPPLEPEEPKVIEIAPPAPVISPEEPVLPWWKRFFNTLFWFL